MALKMSFLKILLALIVIAAILVAVMGFFYMGPHRSFIDVIIGMPEHFACGFLNGSDEDHCIQDAAVRLSDPDICDEIFGYDWQDSPSNPPKDKCYMRVAAKRGEPELCDRLKGGMFSYDREDCLEAVASGNYQH